MHGERRACGAALQHDVEVPGESRVRADDNRQVPSGERVAELKHCDRLRPAGRWEQHRDRRSTLILTAGNRNRLGCDQRI